MAIIYYIGSGFYFDYVMSLYTKYKDEGAILSQIDEENKIFPFAMSEYINSNINLNNLLENEILNKWDN